MTPKQTLDVTAAAGAAVSKKEETCDVPRPRTTLDLFWANRAKGRQCRGALVSFEWFLFDVAPEAVT